MRNDGQDQPSDLDVVGAGIAATDFHDGGILLSHAKGDVLVVRG